MHISKPGVPFKELLFYSYARFGNVLLTVGSGGDGGDRANSRYAKVKVAGQHGDRAIEKAGPRRTGIGENPGWA